MNTVTAAAPITVEEFDGYVALLGRHDWYYCYSDDGGMWRRGQEEQNKLTAIAATHPLYEKAKHAWVQYAFRNQKEISAVAARHDRDFAITALRQQVIAQS